MPAPIGNNPAKLFDRMQAILIANLATELNLFRDDQGWTTLAAPSAASNYSRTLAIDGSRMTFPHVSFVLLGEDTTRYVSAADAKSRLSVDIWVAIRQEDIVTTVDGEMNSVFGDLDDLASALYGYARAIQNVLERDVPRDATVVTGTPAGAYIADRTSIEYQLPRQLDKRNSFFIQTCRVRMQVDQRVRAS